MATCLYASWPVMILPQLERNDLWEIWRAGLAPDPAANNVVHSDADRCKLIRILLCPTNPSDRTGTNDTPLAYVGNAGVHGRPFIAGMQMQGAQRSASSNYPGPPQVYGVFNDMGRQMTIGSRTVLDTHERVSLDYISQHDGTATTLLITENVNAGTWANPTV